MKLNLQNLNMLGKINNGYSLPKSEAINMDNLSQLDEFMKKIISKIKDSKVALEADRFLYDLSHTSDEFSAIEECVRYKYKDFNIVTCLDHFGKPVIDNLKKLNELQIASAPELITTISKDEKLYIITRNKGTQVGDLKPYFLGGKEKLSQQAKLQAYSDMQKLTKAGYVDEQNLRIGSWFYTNENNILLPNWEHLRPIQQNESTKDIISQYYKIIFGE